MNPAQAPAPPAPLVGNRRALVAVLMAVSLALGWPDCADSEVA